MLSLFFSSNYVFYELHKLLLDPYIQSGYIKSPLHYLKKFWFRKKTWTSSEYFFYIKKINPTYNIAWANNIVMT